MNMSTKYRKYPRTPHLPWSGYASGDDRMLDSISHFDGREVVVLEKMDGENTTMYRDHIHARSLDSAHHPSRTQVKRIHAEVAHEIPKDWRVCGENMQACHSIFYADLPDYFLVFSIWDERNRAISWDDTLEWCRLLGLTPVPELFRGTWDEARVRAISVDTSKAEGYVVRVASAFGYQEFSRSVAKWVRPDHVQTDDGWRHQEIVENQIVDRGRKT